MYRITLALVVVLLATPKLFAADLPPSTPYPPPRAPAAYYPPPAPAFTWTGLYLGVQGGYESLDVSPFDGGLVGGQIGLNYQFANAAVAGIEVDGAYAFLKGIQNIGGACNAGIIICANYNYSLQSNALGTARGRFGYAFDTVLVYGTAGVAGEQLKQTSTINSCGVGVCTSAVTSSNGMRYGWVAGGGVEWAFVRNVSLKAEFLYGAVESATLNSSAFAGANAVYVGKVGLNFLFH